jgi:hypothetical protein
MSERPALVRAMVSMIRSYQRGDHKECYRKYFELEFDDRELVRETFKQARKDYPTKAARKDAKGIYKLLVVNLNKEVGYMIGKTKELLGYWWDNKIDLFDQYYTALSDGEKDLFMEALKTMEGKDSEKFTQSLKDLQAFIQSKSSNQ